MDTSIVKQQYASMLRQCLEEIQFKVPPTKYDPLIEEAVVAFLQKRGFAAAWIVKAKPAIETASWIAKSTFPFVPANLQELIATYTGVAIMIEDTSDDHLADLKAFGSRLADRQPQRNRLLEAFVTVMQRLRRLFAPFIGDMIVKSTIEFVSVCVLEREYDGRLSLPTTCPDFPDYIRHKSGIGEAYSLFAFPEALFPEEECLRVFLPVIPDLGRFINIGNDFFSFYKESVVSDERTNYVYNHSRAHGITPIQSLESVMASMAMYSRNVLDTLAGNPEMQANIRQLFSGYATYHMAASRYRLDELDMPEVSEVRQVVCLPRHVPPIKTQAVQPAKRARQLLRLLRLKHLVP